MRTNLPVTGREFKVPGGVALMSTTDVNSHISYANSAFIHASGFEMKKLMGQPHNLVRHPDMPSAAYADMWNTLKAGLSWNTPVKNRRKNGDHDWVAANAVPMRRHGQLAGYVSVRTRLGLSAMFTGSAAVLPALLAARTPVHGLAEGVARLAAVGLGSVFLCMQISAPLRKVLDRANQVATGDTLPAEPLDRADEIGLLMRAVNQAGLDLRALVDDVAEQAGGVAAASKEIASGSNDLSARTEQTAASMEQITQTIKQNSATSAAARKLAEQAFGVAAHGSEAMHQVQHQMSGIQGHSARIADIVGVVDSIAFQTNILALNAAVEAARAGEQGQGFSVVAAEVRSLAQRSAAAAREIKSLIDASVQQVNTGCEHVQRAGAAIERIVEQVRQVSTLVSEISQASLQQDLGAEQVHQALTELDGATQQNAALVEQSAAASHAAQRTMNKKDVLRTRVRDCALTLALATVTPLAAADEDLMGVGLERLMQLRVVGASKYEQTSAEVAAAVSVLTRDDIRAFGWRTIEQALASLPGVHTTYDRQYQYLGTRGFGLPGDFNTRVLVMINGNRTNDAVYDGAPTGLQFPLDMALVERIEFIPGPGGAIYGQNAMFGVVNVITRNGADLAGTELSLGMQQPQLLREGRASWGSRLDNGLDVLMSVSGLHAGGEDRALDFGASGKSGVARGLDSARDQELFARVAGGSWSFDFAFSKARKDDPTGSYLSDPLVPGQYEADHYTLAQLQYQAGGPDDAVQLHARLFTGRSRYAAMLSYGTLFGTPSSGEWSGAELRLLNTRLDNHKLMLGIEAQRNRRVDQYILDLAAPVNNIHIQSPGWRTGVYLQDEWRMGNALSATLGLRVDRSDAAGTLRSPRAALIWQAASGTTLKTLYGRAYRAPNAYERDYSDGLALTGNAALQAESIDTLELVADQRAGSGLLLRGSVYQWKLRHLITQGMDPLTGLAQYQSGSRANARGLEISADQSWPWGGRLRASVSLQHAHGDAGRRVLNSPRLLAKTSISTPLPWAGLHLGYELRFDSRRLTRDGSNAGGYALSDLHLHTQALAPGLEIGVGVRNLLAKRYAHPAADTNWQNTLQQDGRSVRLDATYRF